MQMIVIQALRIKLCLSYQKKKAYDDTVIIINNSNLYFHSKCLEK